MPNNEFDVTLAEKEVIEVTINEQLPGTDGNGIASIVAVPVAGGQNVTINYTYQGMDPVELFLPNGEPGDTGKGIAGISKVSTVGLVDTYRITYTDATTTDFTVVNSDNLAAGTDYLTPEAIAEAYQVKKAETELYVNQGEKDVWGAKQDALTADADYLTPETADATYQQKMGEDDNYITDTEKANLHAPHSDDQDLSGLVPKTTTVNGKALNGNISLDYSDVGASASGHTHADLHTHANKTALDNVSNVNTGDETNATIKTKLGTDLTNLQSKSITDAGGYFGTDTVEGALAELGAKGTIVADQTFEAVWKTGTPTADANTDTITLAGHGFTNGMPIEFDAGTGILPGGISAYNDYYPAGTYYNVINATTDTFQICATVGGTTPVDITSAGTSGWQVRSADVAVIFQGLDLTAHKEYDVYILYHTAKKTTAAMSLFLRLNNVSTYKYYVNGISGWGGSTATIFPSVTQKYLFGLIRLNLRLAEANKVLLSSTCGFSQTDDRSAAIHSNLLVSGICVNDGSNLNGFLLSSNNNNVVAFRNGTRVIAIRRS